MIPSRFGSAGGQASALDGRVQLFTAQSAPFLNSVTSPNAASASRAVGEQSTRHFDQQCLRPSLVCRASRRARRASVSSSIIDPGGMPLAAPPASWAVAYSPATSPTGRQQILPGDLRSPAIANAFVGMSPDGSKRAVFVVLTADGALVQAHAEFAVDGLAPAKTIAPIKLPAAADAERAPITRTGMIFNWVPDRTLFIAEPERNAITALTLGNDDKVFRLEEQAQRSRRRSSSTPVDFTPVVPGIANPGFASNTTLAGNSDFYVANRGNGTIVRMRQDGTVVAVRRISCQLGNPLGANRINGIAISPDAQKIWVTVSGAIRSIRTRRGSCSRSRLSAPHCGDAVISPPTPSNARCERPGHERRQAVRRQLHTRARIGAAVQPPLLRAVPRQPHYWRNGLGWSRPRSTRRPFRLRIVRSPHRRRRSRCTRAFDRGARRRVHLTAGPPASANLISVRNAPPLYGLGLIDRIPDAVIRDAAAASSATRAVPTLCAMRSATSASAGWLEGRHRNARAVRRRSVPQ